MRRVRRSNAGNGTGAIATDIVGNRLIAHICACPRGAATQSRKTNWSGAAAGPGVNSARLMVNANDVTSKPRFGSWKCINGHWSCTNEAGDM